MMVRTGRTQPTILKDFSRKVKSNSEICRGKMFGHPNDKRGPHFRSPLFRPALWQASPSPASLGLPLSLPSACGRDELYHLKASVYPILIIAVLFGSVKDFSRKVKSNSEICRGKNMCVQPPSFLPIVSACIDAVLVERVHNLVDAMETLGV